MIRRGDMFWLSKNPVFRALRRAISTCPALYIPLRRLRMSETVVHKGTDLLIEGFPRSSNTWTEALMREAGRDQLDLAHHAHAAAHVKRALALNIPSVILYRDPDDAVVSLLTLHENQLDARGAFLEYVRFYSAVCRLRSPLLRFYSFEDLTMRPADVVEDIKQAFNLPLITGDLETEAGRERVFERMYALAPRLKRARHVRLAVGPDSLDTGSEARRAEAREMVKEAKTAAARAQAYAVYGRLSSDLALAEERSHAR